MTALPAALLVLAAGLAPAATLSELAVRVEEGGVSTIQCGAPELDVDARPSGGRDYVLSGKAGGEDLSWTAKRAVALEAGERVESYRIAGPGFEARLEPLHVDRGDYRLVLSSSGTERSLRLEPDGGGSAVEFSVRGRGVDLRTRTSGPRSVLAGDYDSAALDAPRLAAVGAALALLRLDPPLRRRAR